MDNSDKGQFNEQIRERTIKMAVAVHELLCNAKVMPVTRPIVNQLIRSSSSVAAILALYLLKVTAGLQWAMK
jgi:hypothetical protein